MDFEQKYKAALERMKSWARGEHPECFSEAQKAAEYIFPELKESEDEQIRKTLIDYFQAYKEQKECGITTFYGISTDNILAWLEKQTNTLNKEYVFRPLAGDTIEKAAERAVELGGKVVLAFNGAYISVGSKTKDEIVAEYRNWLEKQCQVKESIISQHEIEMCKENDNSLTGENERIKETLKEFVKGYSAFINGQWRLGDFTVNRLIAWLEKQGEHKPYGQRKECEDCQFNYAGECKGLCKMKRDEQKPADEDEPKFRPGDIVQYITDSTDRRKIEEIDTLCNMYHTDSSPIMFEVEDEWKVVVNAVDVEQESVDKVEPKFHEGEWIVLPLGIIAHVDSLNSTDYQVTTTDGKICDFKISKQDNYHLWTIADAKDGDVLVVDDEYIVSFNDDNGNIGKGINLMITNFHYDVEDDLCACGTRLYYSTVCPATKEQRDLLFAKMKEAGYERNAEKKELKKVEVEKLDADKVIAWLVGNICDFEYYVKRFKQDFGL